MKVLTEKNIAIGKAIATMESVVEASEQVCDAVGTANALYVAGSENKTIPRIEIEIIKPYLFTLLILFLKCNIYSLNLNLIFINYLV